MEGSVGSTGDLSTGSVGSHRVQIASSVTDVSEAAAKDIEDGIHDFVEHSSPESSNPEEDQREDLEEGREDEVVEGRGEREDESTDKRNGPAEDRGQELVEPELSVVEDNEVAAPDVLERVASIRFSNDIVEHDMNLAIDQLFIAVQDVQADGQRLAGLLWSAHLFLLLFSGSVGGNLKRLALAGVSGVDRWLGVTQFNVLHFNLLGLPEVGLAFRGDKLRHALAGVQKGLIDFAVHFWSRFR